MRRIAILIALVACKPKKAEPPPDPPPTGPPSTGHSVTHLQEPDGGVAIDAMVPIDAVAPKFGGNGAPPHRDADGTVHGPGGPVFMGEGPDCDADRNHCLREGTWFLVDNVIAGKIFRALPVFQFEDKWWSWRGEEQTVTHLYRTDIATTKLARGDTVIWFSADTATKKWADSEYDALTSGRWETAIVDRVNATAKTFSAKGWPDPIELDTARVIVETK